MSRPSRLSPPVRKTISIFLGLTLGMLLIAATRRAHLLDAALAKRAIGLIVGVLVMVTGNFLPKTQPLKALHVRSSSAIAAERFAGWALFLGGAVYASLFLFAPLRLARPLSSCVGIAIILAIAADGAWHARRIGTFDRQILNPQIPDPQTMDPQMLEEAAMDRGVVLQGQREILFLLFAVFWIFATACAAFLREDSPRIHSLTSWMALAFGILYAALIPILDSGVCGKKRIRR